ncbi:GMC oxidoreductase [Atractiella rhizophila]|nr:GMC oxidoreductase [Atractiella rhizophila]
MHLLTLLPFLPLSLSTHPTLPSSRFIHLRRSPQAPPPSAPSSNEKPSGSGSGAANQKAFITDNPSHLSSLPPTHIVVGGGQSGLVVARRLLSPTTRVLVIEAGPDWAAHPNDIVIGDGSGGEGGEGGAGAGAGGGETDGEEEATQGWGGANSQAEDGILVKERVEIPGMAWYGGLAYPDSPYDWGYYTVPQPHLKNRQIYWPRGKLLGGSSAVNGLYLVRSSREEQEAWEALWDGVVDERQDVSATKWDWEGVHEWMKKSENYTPPVEEFAQKAGVVWDWDAHGREGPIHYSYPSFFFEQISTWLDTFKNLGIGTRDPGGGAAYDAFVATSAVNPTLHRRSYSRNGYLDPILGVEENLTVLVGHHVTKIDFAKNDDGTLRVTGVKFRSEDETEEHTVELAEGGEVVSCGGVIGSPQLLQLSGVGPRKLLEDLGIEVVLELPGVGQHLQDHLSSQITYLTNAERTGDMIKANQSYAQEQLSIWRNGEPGSMYEAPNDAIAYVNLTTLLGEERATSFMEELNGNLTAALSSLPGPSGGEADPTVLSGYESTYLSELEHILPSPVGQIEILMSNTGRGRGGENSISLQVAIQHPFSRGHVSINSTDPFALPVIDVGYLSHPGDIEVFRAGFRFARKLAETPPLSDILTREIRPGPIVNTDEEWDHFIRGSASTEFHPAGSCSMLPLEKGGVVGKDLKVHGIQNLRVADGSIVPVGLSAHLMAPIYGIAEKGAALVLGSWDAYQTSLAEAAAPETVPGDTFGNEGSYDIPGKEDEPSKVQEADPEPAVEDVAEDAVEEDEEVDIGVTPVEEAQPDPAASETEQDVEEEEWGEESPISETEGEESSNLEDGYGPVDEEGDILDNVDDGVEKVGTDKVTDQPVVEDESQGGWGNLVVQLADYMGIFWFGNL